MRISLILTAALLAGCSAADSTDIDFPDPSKQLTDQLSNEGRDVYGAGGGIGGGSYVDTQVADDRGELRIFALCTGADGQLELTLNHQEPVSLPCHTDGSPQDLSDKFEVKGNRMVLTVEDAPANARWSVAAVSDPK